MFVDRQRDHARQPARRGAARLRATATSPGPQWLHENVLRDKWVLAVAGHARQDDDGVDARVDPRAHRAQPGIPDRRRADELRRVGAARRQRVLRDRGRRIRHGVLRQALEVRPLPSAHGDPQQPRVRSRRHLPRPGGDRDAVPPSRAHGAARGTAHRQRRGGEPRPRARARLLVGGRILLRRRARAARGRADARVAHRARRQGHARQRAAGNRALAGRRDAARPAQPA